ncbi:tryptophan halogenase family protein [Bauldia sp.]|uniref:tryptophan halogenase family protein n=1 Tax=Bauldia sp. TaxID=2575872 RepID=UPI003BAD2BE5
MITPIRHLVIVGGGTAGWLAALMLARTAKDNRADVKITVVESSKIPTIGVGEGTTAVFKTVLDHLGINEADFLRETRGTIKYGIRHKDWRRVGVTYDGPIDDPHALVEGAGTSEFLNIFSVAAGRPVSRLHLFDRLIKADLSPYGRDDNGRLAPVGPFQYAYHIDAAAVGRYLRAQAKGIEIVDATVAGVEKNAETGFIEALVFDEGTRLSGDFFIDCTGFRRQLIGKEMDGGWVSYADELPVNRAMPFWLDHEPDAEIQTTTMAWAQKAGWMWQIPTQDRLGCGYVYSDRFLEPDEAKAEIEAALGRTIEPRADIKMSVGRVARPWVKNCLALGLSAGFLEPLEATSIHGTVVQLLVLAEDYFKPDFAPSTDAAEDYSQRVGRQIDDFRTFINVHYVTERDDTPFWRHVREACIHPEARERLDSWRTRMPTGDDFETYLSGFPHIEAQLYYPVLDGLGLLDQAIARRSTGSSTRQRQARDIADGMERQFATAARRAIGHREFLERL